MKMDLYQKEDGIRRGVPRTPPDFGNECRILPNNLLVKKELKMMREILISRNTSLANNGWLNLKRPNLYFTYSPVLEDR